MARILALAGWGQPYDALAGIVPEATHFDYADYEAADAISAIAAQMKTHESIIGWSLGGQLAVRALAAGMARPKRLVLIATPYQFVASQALNVGMQRNKFEKFRSNYEANALRTLTKAWELIVKDDSKEARIRTEMDKHDKAKALAKDWLRWLHSLDHFTCEGLNFAEFPPTLLVHGEKDVVVTPDQSFCFVRSMPHAKLAVWPDCGHAPHWHDPAGFKQLVAEHLHV